jgi:hypothetical protein
MVIVVGNSRRLRQSKKLNAGTNPLTALARKPVRGAMNWFTSSKRGTCVGLKQSVSKPSRKRGLA